MNLNNENNSTNCIESILKDLDNTSNKIKNSIDYNDYEVRTIIHKKSNNSVKGNFLIAHKDDINNLTDSLTIKNTIEVNPSKAIKFIIILTLILIIIHDVFQYSSRFKNINTIDLNRCTRDFDDNQCQKILSSTDDESPFLIEKCYSLSLCLKKDYFTISNFIYTQICSFFSNINWYKDLNSDVLSETSMMVLFTILSIIIFKYI
jgi:hypothetical protein